MQKEVKRLENFILEGYKQTNSKFGCDGIFIEDNKKLVIRYEISENHYVQEDYGTGITCTYKELFKPWHFEKENYSYVENYLGNDYKDNQCFEYYINLEKIREPFRKKLLSMK